MAGNEDSTPEAPLSLAGNARKKARDDERHMHYAACDELIGEAIDLLSLLGLYAHLDDLEAGKRFPADATAVATAARTIAEKLRKAQSHHREVLL